MDEKYFNFTITNRIHLVNKPDLHKLHKFNSEVNVLGIRDLIIFVIKLKINEDLYNNKKFGENLTT